MLTGKPQTALLRQARREAVIVAVLWALSLLWTVGYCYLQGYTHAADSWLVQVGLARSPDVPFVQYAGLPAWALFGIFIPWIVCSSITVLFGLVVMQDADLGADSTKEGGHAH